MLGPRVALVVEYDGADFHGWQIQPDARSVQGDLESALSQVADTTISTVCAGRTDAGVHGMAQVVHFDCDHARTSKAWIRGANANMPSDVRVLHAVGVDGDFHARFGALSRHYRYLILNQAPGSALYRDRALHVRRELDVAAMQQAATVLIGEHDFSAFRAASCQAHQPVRTVFSLTVTTAAPWIVVDIAANAFLQNMVRIIVGALLRIGRGHADADWLARVLAERDRRHAAVTAPSHGLYLSGVDYEPRYRIPSGPLSGGLFAPDSTIMAP